MTRNALSHMCHEYHDVWHVTGMSHSCHVSHNEDFNTRPCREKTQSDVGEIIFKSSTGVSYSLKCLKPHDYYYYENLRWQRIATVGEAARKINLSPRREQIKPEMEIFPGVVSGLTSRRYPASSPSRPDICISNKPRVRAINLELCLFYQHYSLLLN